MKKTMLTRGFTLIELLVVIAIIGILAAVVIGSLNDARSGGQDASIKQSVANIRSQAELYYNANGYAYYVGAADNVCFEPQVAALLDAAVDVVNGTAYVAANHGVDANVALNTLTGSAAGREAACRSEETRYVAVAPLASVNQFWCVDSTGSSMQVAAAPVAGDYTCN
jgi:prepilin-type N-terminal cleavage/methylation domain-containing protein